MKINNINKFNKLWKGIRYWKSIYKNKTYND